MTDIGRPAQSGQISLYRAVRETFYGTLGKKLFTIEQSYNIHFSSLIAHVSPRHLSRLDCPGRQRIVIMPNDSHQRAAEFHELAAHAHRAAAVHHGKEDHQTGHEHSKQALEYANKAMEWSQQAHQKSANSAGKS
jgi:hypothetical protein